MVKLRAFRALRPPPERAAAVAAVPYDVVDTAEARELAGANELSWLHVSRPEIDLPEETDIHADEVYARGQENFQKMIRSVPLLEDEAPAVYVYSLRMGGHVQTGVVACCSVEDYDAGIIKKHEKTRPDKENDRTRHILTLRAQTEPLFLIHRPTALIDRRVAEAAVTRPLYSFTAPDGVAHTLWRAADARSLEHAFAALDCAYIADGHHRAASASRACNQLREGGAPDASAEHEWMLAVLFPSDQVQILPYNRVVADLNGLRPSELLGRVSDSLGLPVPLWDGAGESDPAPARRGVARMYLSGSWYTLRLDPPPGAAPTESLDVSILNERVLNPILGIEDPRTDPRIDFVGGIRGTRELARRVDSGKAAVAFALHATTVDELLAVADAGAMMPPKSTWFEPKLRSGLLIHRI